MTLATDAASWEYSVDGGSNWSTGSDTALSADNTTFAINDIQVRQTDTAGNTSAAAKNAAQIVTDMTVAAPTFALNADTGSSNSDGITNDATVNVTLATDAASWEYEWNSVLNWSTGSNTSFELADDTTFAINDIQVRQTDTAGNTSAAAKNAAPNCDRYDTLSAPPLR